MIKIRLFISIIIAGIVGYCLFNMPKSNRNQIKLVNGFPVKPSKGPPYINFSSLKFLDPIAKFEMGRGREFVNSEFAMVILESLPSSHSLEDYAANLFKLWDIGRQTSGRGVLYLMVLSEGLLKIETSYELEALFPDTFINSYQDTIKEFYKKEQLGDVISHLVVEMIHRIQDPTYQMSLYQNDDAVGDYLSGGGGISGKGYVVNRIEKNLARTNNEKFLLTKYEKANSPDEAVDKFLLSFKEGISSPNLGILTEGSRYMAMEYKRTAGYQINRSKEYQKALPYKINQKGEYALAYFSRDNVRPIYLRQNKQGFWFVDEVRMWTSYDAHIGKDSDHYFNVGFFNGSPWSFAFNFPRAKPRPSGADRPNPLPLSYNLKDIIQMLEENVKNNPDSSEAYFILSDVLFFELYWVKDALKAIEKGLTLDPTNERYLRRAIYYGVKLPDFSKTAEHYETLIKIRPNDKFLRSAYDCFKKNNVTCL